ncbi:uncharacterized protein EV420DRAFT_1647759 [Desarmillaria tabescens]|uniref:Uncharacterized protein n=1 Tax=Armillaria tabescens TaxID=1929756 RepID=A0AA39JU21_ARMTA|nr:uncharacterized protein EV420DRAFT_1647759 [Desarmillaria tabescens]KAK0447429.1 hypothetical protein EV420DRAFT_1647759 [Desarmillaria tabescens]
MSPVARSAPHAPQSRPSVMVGIIIGCIVALYLVVVLFYYLCCSISGTFFVQRSKERTVPYSEAQYLVDFISASGKPRQSPDLYTTPVMRYRFLFRQMYPGRRRSPFEFRRIVCLPPSPLRHLLASRFMNEEELLLHDSSSRQGLKSKASPAVTIICSLDYIPLYDGPYPLGTVTCTLGKPIKGIFGDDADGKENQPIPEVLIQEEGQSVMPRRH